MQIAQPLHSTDLRELTRARLANGDVATTDLAYFGNGNLRSVIGSPWGATAVGARLGAAARRGPWREWRGAGGGRRERRHPAVPDGRGRDRSVGPGRGRSALRTGYGARWRSPISGSAVPPTILRSRFATGWRVVVGILSPALRQP